MVKSMKKWHSFCKHFMALNWCTHIHRTSCRADGLMCEAQRSTPWMSHDYGAFRLICQTSTYRWNSSSVQTSCDYVCWTSFFCTHAVNTTSAFVKCLCIAPFYAVSCAKNWIMLVHVSNFLFAIRSAVSYCAQEDRSGKCQMCCTCNRRATKLKLGMSGVCPVFPGKNSSMRVSFDSFHLQITCCQRS